MQIKFTFIQRLILLGFLSSCVSSKIQPEITKGELFQHIEFLADSSLKGRYPGTPEDKIAMEYIVANLSKTGLELLFDRGKQVFEVSTQVEAGNNNSLSIDNQTFEVFNDFTPIAFSANSTIEAEVVFVGYGLKIDQGEELWDDYANVDVKGKLVLILIGEPKNANTQIPFAMYSSLRSKAITAKDQGAAGVIFISGKNEDEGDELTELFRPEGKMDIPIIHIKREVANVILKNTGKTIDDLDSLIKNSDQSVQTNSIVKCQTEIISESYQTYNAAAQLISKPKSKYIVIGAHYDHLGLGGVGTGSRAPNSHEPHYGADDNASGVASMLEIAEKLASKKDSLKNNFIFVAFGAEEMGLIGSKYFVNHLPIPDSLIKLMINIDMVGRMKDDNSVQIGGVGTSIEGESILESLNKQFNFKLGLSKEGYGPSDHSSFYTKNIPVFFISTGPHIDYHTPGDSLGNINFNGLTKVSEYIYDLAFNIASQDKKLTYQEAGPKMPSGEQRNKKLKVTLGIMPDFTGVEKTGLRADLVIKGKPADIAGMKAGDIIVAINGLPVGDVYEYMERLSKLKPGQIISVEIKREDKKEVLIVQL